MGANNPGVADAGKEEHEQPEGGVHSETLKNNYGMRQEQEQAEQRFENHAIPFGGAASANLMLRNGSLRVCHRLF